MSEKPHFPVFLDLSEKKVIVVGAGTIAKRRIRTLAEFTYDLTVIAPEVNSELKLMEEAGKIKILRKHYERDDLYGADMVIAAASDKKINNDIHAACKCLGIPVNVPDDRTKCDFFFPGLVKYGDMVAAVSSGGKSRKESNKLLELIGGWMKAIQEKSYVSSERREQEL